MNKIGYIISKNKINCEYEFIGVVNDINEVITLNKPCLVIGLNEAKKIDGWNNILEKKINENIFWTFSKTERRNDFEKDLNSFYDFVISETINKVKYYYINLFKLKFTKAKKILNIINNNDKKYIYISNNMIYIYYNNIILGVSRKIISYLNIDFNKIKKLLTNNKANIIFTYNSFYNYKMNKILENKKYVLPYFMSKISE